MSTLRKLKTPWLATLLLAGCVSSKPWDGTLEFREQLTCGLSPEEVFHVAMRFEGLVPVGQLRKDWVVEATGDPPRMIQAISPGGTAFELGFA